jgi:hypothetical protein
MAHNNPGLWAAVAFLRAVICAEFTQRQAEEVLKAKGIPLAETAAQ